MHDETHHPEVLRRLIAIDHKTDAIKDSLAWLVRANEPELKKKLLEAFGSSKRRVQVYLSLDGNRNVGTITRSLGMKQENVSIEIAWLKKKGLIVAVQSRANGTVYAKSSLDTTVELSEALAKKFNFDVSGHPQKKKK